MVGFSLFFIILPHNLTKSMKYYEVLFRIEAPQELYQDACDTVAALAGSASFETFEEVEGGLKGYVQQSLFSQDELEEVMSMLPFNDVHLTFEVTEAEDKDWNEQWEQEGFEPIIVDDSCIIHDGRHLPTAAQTERLKTLAEQRGTQQVPIAVEIDAKLAFGTGTHETTRMIVGTLLRQNLNDKTVLDCGCGTGILGIVALKLGARECLGYDIDEWSVDNACHNAVINHVDQHFTALLGDATLLYSIDASFDIVLANINRNILLNDLPLFRSKMREGGLLVLSGFYTEDIPLLTEKAETMGLQVSQTLTDNNWACLTLCC